MQRIKRQRPPTYILMPDTNVLWHEKKDLCASPEFNKFWDEYGTKYDIELVLPEVVKGELIYQHTTSALTTLDRINAQFDNLSNYANKEYKHRVQPQRVKNDIESKFNIWLAGINAEIIETPIDTIDWKRLVNDAIWRHPPFLEEKDKKSEKGFRDSLILETVISIAESRPKTNLAFVTNDTVLLNAAKSRLKSNNYCSLYETLDEFSSFLRLIDEKFTNEFIRAIQKRARLKFYNSKDQSCLLSREQIITKIREEFEHEFTAPSSRRSLGLALSGVPSPPTENWEEASDEGIWIKAPSYIEHRKEKEFFWDTRITFVKLYKNVGTGVGGLLTALSITGQENIRKLEFKTIWKAHVGKDAKFRNLKLVDIQLADKKFEMATEEDKKQYGIESTIE